MDNTAKIQAIKLIRDKTEMGLRAAKLAIEAYAAEHPRADFGEIVDAVVNANPRGPAAPTYAELAADVARLRAALQIAYDDAQAHYLQLCADAGGRTQRHVDIDARLALYRAAIQGETNANT